MSLLYTGVRIDLDEKYLSLSIRDYEERSAYGRDTYTSAFDLISSQCKKFPFINLAGSEILRKCVEVLMSYRGQHPIKTAYLSGKNVFEAIIVLRPTSQSPGLWSAIPINLTIIIIIRSMVVP